MSDSLRSLSDKEILNRTHALTLQERKVTISLLLHLNEVERRKLHLKLGHPSMFEYCTDGLGYSTAAAVRRLQTARSVARFPRVLELLERNEVNLSTVSRVSKLLSEENCHAVLDRIRHRSQREVEAIVAEYDPLSGIPRDRVRTVVVRMPLADSNHIRSGCDANPGSPVGDPGVGPERASPIAADADAGPAGPATLLAGAARLERRTLVQFSARDEVMALLQRVRAVASHRLAGDASFEELVALLARYFLDREDPAARHERRATRANRATGDRLRSRDDESSRRVPARVRDAIFARDGYRCTYVGPDGKRCTSTRLLQLDHVTPVARGGASTTGNLRLLCAHHNRLEAKRVMGEGVCSTVS